MSENEPAFYRRKLQDLRVEHRALDEKISLMEEERTHDELEIRRLKKRKLQLRDYMAMLESRLIPDIDA